MYVFNKTLTICTIDKWLCNRAKRQNYSPLSLIYRLIILMESENIFIKIGVGNVDSHTFNGR